MRTTSETTQADETTTTTTTAAPETPATTTTAEPEPFTRPAAMYFVAERRPDGEPVEHLAGYGIAARDYLPGDPMLGRLTDEQMALALDSKLYVTTKPAGTKPDAASPVTPPKPLER